MRFGFSPAVAQSLVIALASLWLAGCNTTSRTASVAENPAATLMPPGADAQALASPAAAETTGSVTPRSPKSDEDVTLGKQQYRAGNFDSAAKAFSRAANKHPRDAEAWLGLAAAYDRLRQFDLADSAYDQATLIDGQTAEILNNQGYSYMLRGDLTRARASLTAAKAKDPANRYVQNNLQLLADASANKKTAR